MTFDKPEHKQFVLEMIRQVMIPGHAIDLAYEFKKAVEEAEVKEECKQPKSANTAVPVDGS